MDKQALKDYKKELTERFVMVEFGGLVSKTLLVDKETGVEYLAHGAMYGITPLLTTDGKPKINAKWQAGDL